MFAVLIKAVIPAGCMPDMLSDQTFKMVICTGEGAKTVEVGSDFNPYHKSGDKKEKQHEIPCHFSVNTAFTETGFLPVAYGPALVPSLAAHDALHAKILPVRFFFGNASSQSPPVFFYA